MKENPTGSQELFFSPCQLSQTTQKQKLDDFSELSGLSRVGNGAKEGDLPDGVMLE